MGVGLSQAAAHSTLTASDRCIHCEKPYLCQYTCSTGRVTTLAGGLGCGRGARVGVGAGA